MLFIDLTIIHKKIIFYIDISYIEHMRNACLKYVQCKTFIYVDFDF